MAIPEAQLTTWAQIGAQVTSQETYATIKLALENGDAGYAGKRYKAFLQGSYRNDTNIFKESDVDVVMKLDEIFSYDLSQLPPAQATAFTTSHPAAQYNHNHFRADVLAVLNDRFGDHAVPGTKAVTIKPFHNRRKADVLIAIQHRKYSRFTNLGNDAHVEGICFYKSDGTKVVNYPKLHRTNLAAQNQATAQWMKHVVRIFKNARERLITEGELEAGIAPSYYLEGLLYNVPANNFGPSYADSVHNCLAWLSQEADLSTFVCANRQYMLLDDNPDVSWTTANCQQFMNALIALWNDW